MSDLLFKRFLIKSVDVRDEDQGCLVNRGSRAMLESRARMVYLSNQICVEHLRDLRACLKDCLCACGNENCRLDSYRSSISESEVVHAKADDERFVSVFMPPREGFNNQRQALSIGMC